MGQVRATGARMEFGTLGQPPILGTSWCPALVHATAAKARLERMRTTAAPRRHAATAKDHVSHSQSLLSLR